jgi:uncharacterized protein involved in exopolysaccharide biosynthesis
METGRRTSAHTGAEGGDLSLLRLLDLLLRHRWLATVVTLIVAALIIAWAALRPASWTAESRFMPTSSGSKGPAALQGLAGQFGIDIAGFDNSEPLEFYSELVKSRDILRAVALTDVKPKNGAPQRLIDVLEPSGDTPDERLRNALDVLRDQYVQVSLHRQAGLVSIKTTAKDAAVAAAMNRELLRLVDEFNLEKRQTQAAQERRFVQGRMVEIGKELRGAESELRAFMEQNRRVESPQLVIQRSRLQNRVETLQQVHSSLVQSYEQARINEVRNTPVITVIQQPEGALEREDRSLPLFIVAGLMVGLVASIVMILLMNQFSNQMAASELPEVQRLYSSLKTRRGKARVG